MQMFLIISNIGALVSLGINSWLALPDSATHFFASTVVLTSQYPPRVEMVRVQSWAGAVSRVCELLRACTQHQLYW
jgi:hypothetical protein